MNRNKSVQSYFQPYTLCLFTGLLVSQISIPAARAEQEGCVPNQAVYVRHDGSEFIVRHFGRVDEETHEIRYLEGELNGEKVAFITTEGTSTSRTAGKFMDVLDNEYARRARYEVEWHENPTNREADKTLFSDQESVWKGEWKLIRCDGKSDRAAKIIQASQSLNCPIDKVSFIDENTGRRFNAERYAEEFGYLYPGDKPRKGKNGPYVRSHKRVGYRLIRGSLQGSQAYLLHKQILGTPGNSFRSYYPDSRHLVNLKPKWVSGRAVPMVTNQNRDEFTFEEIDTRDGTIYQTGPLTGMRLVPVACNKKDER
jgi:hypothetical protein